MGEKKVRGRRYRITYKRRGWGNVEFVKIYEHEVYGLEIALAGFIRDHSLARDEIVRVEEIEDAHAQNQNPQMKPLE